MGGGICVRVVGLVVAAAGVGWMREWGSGRSEGRCVVRARVRVVTRATAAAAASAAAGHR